MSGNREGGLKAAKANMDKYGPDFYAKIGKKGGKAKVPKGFALMTEEDRSNAGRKGGAKSRRGSTKPHNVEGMEYEDIG